MKLLILGGTGEARRLAELVASKHERWSVTYSLAGRTLKAREPARCFVRTGGFGGDAAFFECVRNFDALIDATHPFAAKMHWRTSMVEIPALCVVRPAWRHNGEGFSDAQKLARRLDRDKPGRWFLALGSYGWQPFADIDCQRLFLRGLAKPAALPGQIEFIEDKPGASVEAEVQLFRQLEVDGMITRNAGGDQGRAKLQAAEQLGLKLYVIERPAMPLGLKRVETEFEAAQWLSRL